jgi:hypothetical protein
MIDNVVPIFQYKPSFTNNIWSLRPKFFDPGKPKGNHISYTHHFTMISLCFPWYKSSYASPKAGSATERSRVPEFPCPAKAAKALWSNAMRTIYDEIMEKAFGHIRVYTGITVYEYMICCIYTHIHSIHIQPYIWVYSMGHLLRSDSSDLLRSCIICGNHALAKPAYRRSGRPRHIWVFQTLKDAWSSFEHDTRLFTASANQIKAVWEALAFSDKVKQPFVSKTLLFRIRLKGVCVGEFWLIDLWSWTSMDFSVFA